VRALLQPLPATSIVAVAAVLAVLAYGVTSSGHNETIDDALAEGRRVPAPDLALPRLEGRAKASLGDYRGKVVVLNFWASWCVRAARSHRCCSAGTSGSARAEAPSWA
jgi:thiol-disulfide isomerase/thioredoxin